MLFPVPERAYLDIIIDLEGLVKDDFRRERCFLHVISSVLPYKKTELGADRTWKKPPITRLCD